MKLFEGTDPFRSRLVTKLRGASSKLESELTASELAQLIEKPPEAKMGDYALPCFRLAKIWKTAPVEIAHELQLSIEAMKLPWLAKIEVAGAFLNFFIARSALAQDVLGRVLDGSFFELQDIRSANAGTKIMVEFSQPNTHKEFHVGHARNVCLGDTLCRLFRYLGFPIVAANYIGDEGTHVAKCLWQVDKKGGLPANTAHPAYWYGQCYVEASRRLSSASPQERLVYNREISKILAELENKRGKFYTLWLESRNQCMDEFRRIYAWLDVHFDCYFYESELSSESQAIVDEYIAKGLFQESEGAWGIDMRASKLGFFMARKSDGTTPYITKDLALARHKFGQHQIDRSIYVVGSEQEFHFKQLFKALELMGFDRAKNCFHLSYAHVRLPDGKMSSRVGNTLSFAFLRDELLKELMPYLDKYRSEWSDAELQETADRLAIGAIKYGMLASDPAREIVFDLKSWTAFEGDTGPYLLYSYARARSVLSRCEGHGWGHALSSLDRLDKDIEWELLRLIYDYNQTVVQSCESYKPSILCHHLFAMCKAFNRFYAEVSIIKCQDEDERSALIALLAAFLAVLCHGLQLLGISPPESM